MIVALILIAIIILAYGIYAIVKARKTMKELNALIDSTVEGKSSVRVYSESRLYQLSMKLERFLSSTEASQLKTREDQENVKSMISDISHQTKTSISNILMYSELLLEDKSLSSDTKNLALKINEQSGKLNFLIQALVKASRLESGLIVLDIKTNSINILIKSIISEHAFKAESKGVAINFIDSEEIFASFDIKWAAEALSNILDNAIKYTPSGGNISINIEPLEMFIKITIKDTGIGISEENLAQVFSRFYKCDNSSEGVGIGLYLAREIMLMQDGYIKVSSMPGVGSSFMIFLRK